MNPAIFKTGLRDMEIQTVATGKGLNAATQQAE
ncbi:hypothetical protein Patl1_34652 [Pistacia atlantica]|uniref:Uncharacterized protein n=1 Tax=Pistacia atlantica TaxID=434234 RepID=A0ACC0ZW53_9ROSI|nr:hypothetical protein Patl1_34652 [Pistacia atlantica]